MVGLNLIILARVGGGEFIAVLVGMEFPNDWDPVVNRLLLLAANLLKVRDKDVEALHQAD